MRVRRKHRRGRSRALGWGRRSTSVERSGMPPESVDNTCTGPPGGFDLFLVAWLGLLCHRLNALMRAPEAEDRHRHLIDQALAPNESVAAVSQGLSLHRSR